MKLYLLERVSGGEVIAIAIVRATDKDGALEKIVEESKSESWRGYSTRVTQFPDESDSGVLLYEER